VGAHKPSARVHDLLIERRFDVKRNHDAPPDGLLALISSTFTQPQRAV
jgi:hypothetical protein